MSSATPRIVWPWALVLGLVWACGGQSGVRSKVADGKSSASAPGGATVNPSAGVASAAKGPGPSTDTQANALPTVARQVVDGVLRAGPGKFLQHFELEPSLKGRAFVGWKIVALLGPREQWSGIDLHEGDVVTRVNGFTLERDSDYFRAFQSLAVASEIRVQLLRAGVPVELRWTIAES